MSLKSFTDAYVEAALWSSSYGDTGEHNLDDGKHKLAQETRDAMLADCAKFYGENESLICDENHGGSYDCDEQAGHDFWLTRNGHGAGFWDGDWKEPAASQLTDAAHAAGMVDLYVGDDGLIYYA